MSRLAIVLTLVTSAGGLEPAVSLLGCVRAVCPVLAALCLLALLAALPWACNISQCSQIVPVIILLLEICRRIIACGAFSAANSSGANLRASLDIAFDGLDPDIGPPLDLPRLDSDAGLPPYLALTPLDPDIGLPLALPPLLIREHPDPEIGLLFDHLAPPPNSARPRAGFPPTPTRDAVPPQVLRGRRACRCRAVCDRSCFCVHAGDNPQPAAAPGTMELPELADSIDFFPAIREEDTHSC